MAVTGSGDLGAASPRDLEALYAISVAISTSSNLEQVLDRVLPAVLGAFGMPAGVVRRLDAATGELYMAAAAGLVPELAEAMRSPVRATEAPYGLAVQNREVTIIPDLRESPYQGSAWVAHGYRTFISAPLASKGMVLGTINLAAREIRDFSERDRELLSAMLGQIALAVANTELYAAAQRKIQYLSALHQCSQDIGPAPDLERVVQIVVERFAQLLKLERSAVLLHDHRTEEMVGGGGFGFKHGTVESMRLPLEELPGTRALIEEGSLTISDDPVGEQLVPRAFASANGVRSLLAVPLAAHDEAIGILVGDRGGAPLRFSSDELEMAMIFARQASVWIAGARLLIQEQAARAEAEAARRKFSELLELAPDAILHIDGDGRIRLVNSQTEAMFGYRRHELLGQPIEALLPERYRQRHVAHRGGYMASPRTRPMGSGLELFAARKDGSEVPVEISLSPAAGDEGQTVICVVRDITERKQAAQERELLLAREKKKSEQLKLAIREAHHRIKNNLQAISDLLYLEQAAGDGASREDVLRESVERIQSIAVVHDLLSQEEDVQTVDIRALAERLVPMALRSSGGSAGVNVEIEVASVPLSSKRATALALILNELITNAAKHGLSGNRHGRLEVKLEEADDGLRLQVIDNGRGLPQGFDLPASSSVGLQVVRTLAERDLGGRFTLTGGAGVTATVWFPW